MAGLGTVADHLTVKQLRERFHRCTDAVEKIHIQAIMLRKLGRTTADVAEICGFNRDWVRRLVRRYNDKGPDALRDGRRNNGKKRLLADDQLQELRDAILTDVPPGGGLWTGPKVAKWMSAKLKRRVSPQLAWEYLCRLGMSKQSPRPRHARASAEAQTAFKKNSAGV